MESFEEQKLLILMWLNLSIFILQLLLFASSFINSLLSWGYEDTLLDSFLRALQFCLSYLGFNLSVTDFCVAKEAVILGSLQGLGSVHPSQPCVSQSLSILIAVLPLSSFTSEQLWFYFDFWSERAFRDLPYLLRDQQCLKETGPIQGLVVPQQKGASVNLISHHTIWKSFTIYFAYWSRSVHIEHFHSFKRLHNDLLYEIYLTSPQQWTFIFYPIIYFYNTAVSFHT